MNILRSGILYAFELLIVTDNEKAGFHSVRMKEPPNESLPLFVNVLI